MLTSRHISLRAPVSLRKTSEGFSSHSWCKPDLGRIHYWLRSKDLFPCCSSPSSLTPHSAIFGGVGITSCRVGGFLSALECYGFSSLTGCNGPIWKYYQHSLFNLITLHKINLLSVFHQWNLLFVLYIALVSNSVREVPSPAPPVSHFLCFFFTSCFRPFWLNSSRRLFVVYCYWSQTWTW